MNLHLYTVKKLRLVCEPELVDEVLDRLSLHGLDDVTVIEAKGRGSHGPHKPALEKRRIIEVLLSESKVNDVMEELRSFLTRSVPIIFYLEDVRVLRREQFL